MRDHKAFMWVDASIRFSPCIIGKLPGARAKLASSGILMLRHSRDMLYGTTNPGLYHYLPTNLTLYRPLHTYGAGTAIIGRNMNFTRGVMRWLILCALDAKCIAPPGATFSCQESKVYKGLFAKCHRYDHSVLGVLSANHFDFNTRRYTNDVLIKCFKVKRGSITITPIKPIC